MVKELVELLRQARQEKGISLREISEQTRIQRHYLEALETGNFHLFPGEIYLKGTLKSYAVAVGLDPDKALNLYYCLKGENLAGEQETAPPKKAVIRPVRGAGGPPLIYGLIVVALMLVIGGYWFMKQDWLGGKSPLPVDNSGPSGLVEPPKPTKPEESGSEISGNNNNKPELAVLAEKSTSRETVFSVRNVKSLEVELTCTTRCWIRMLVDEKEEFAPRNFQKDETVTVKAKEQLWIRLGHPPGTMLTLNNVAVDEIGKQKNAHNFLFLLEQ